MTTAIIGVGNIGSRLARELADGGERIIVADRTFKKAQMLAGALGGDVEAMEVDDAIKSADVVVLAVYFDAIKALLADKGSVFTGKIVVDPSNPIAPDGNGGFRKTIPEDQSSGQLIAGLLPDGAKLVKAFGTLGAQSLEAAANRTPERAVLFYANDDTGAGETVARLIAASGFAPVRVGGIDQSIRIEVGGDLHEFGKLGRTVSANEARALV